MRHRREVENRIGRLETGARLGEVEYTFPGGAHARLSRSDQVSALHEAVDGVKTWRASVLLNAVSCSDGSHLHDLAAALAAGPVLTTPPAEPDVTREETMQ